MRPDRMVLSAYVDGEIPERYVPQIRHAIDSDPDVRAAYEELRAARAALSAEVDVDVARSAARSWAAIEDRLRNEAPVSGDVWHRRVTVPLPALAAAAVTVLALAGVLIWSLVASEVSDSDYLSRGNDVDVTIRVDGSDMEQVLQWLVDQNMLGEVSIQLPEQQFQIVGEPVFVKPATYSGEVPQ